MKNKKMVKYNFTPTHDPVIAKDYCGYIDKDGAFYMVSLKYEHKPTHNEWAEEYLMHLRETAKDKKEANKILNDELNYGNAHKYLMRKLGFLYYSHSMDVDRKPIIIYPKRSFLNQKNKTSEKQIKMLNDVLFLNKEYDYIKEDKKDYYDSFIDDFIEKQEKENKK